MLYLSRDSHQELYILYKQSDSVLLYFILTKVSTKYMQFFGHFNTFIE